MSAPRRPQSRPRPTRGSRWSLSLGHLAGIDVRVHVTFAILLGLVLATSGEVQGGAPAAVGWLVLVFSCVLIHELSHCAVARRRGVGVDEIMLLPIGGVSRMDRLPESPVSELAIAIAGPLASLGLALLAAAVTLGRGDAVLPVDMFTGPLPTRLFWFNLLLGGFNLLPAFPLDGGRVFRALLERRMDLEQATHRAARLGRSIAVVLVVVGVLLNVWLIVIGVFIYLGAGAEEAVTVLHQRLAGRHVSDLMLLDPMVLEAGSPAGEVVPRLRHTAQRVFPVVDGGWYRGMISARTLETTAPMARVGDLIDTRTSSVTDDEPVEDGVLELLQTSPHHALSVLHDARVVGLLTMDDVRHLLEQPPPPQPLPPHPPPPR